MALTGDEIRARLSAFAAEWIAYDRSERSEAQTFLKELFDCYGTDRKRVAEFEKHQEGKFVDLIWPEVCLIEIERGEAARAASQAGPRLLA